MSKDKHRHKRFSSPKKEIDRNSFKSYSSGGNSSSGHKPLAKGLAGLKAMVDDEAKTNGKIKQNDPATSKDKVKAPSPSKSSAYSFEFDFSEPTPKAKDYVQHYSSSKIREKLFESEPRPEDIKSPKKSNHPQRTIDLHGLNREQCRIELSNFLIRAYRENLGRVLVITGKGLNSPGRKSVLREEVIKILEEDSMKLIRTYEVAQAKLGGHGAFVVTLRT